MKIIKKCSTGDKANYFDKHIPKHIVNKLAVESGLIKRCCKKITPNYMVSSFIDMIFGSSFSYQKWAIFLSKKANQSVSKQAIHKRTTDNFIIFLQLILAYLLTSSLRQIKTKKTG